MKQNKFLIVLIIFLAGQLKPTIIDRVKSGAISVGAGAISGMVPFYCAIKIHDTEDYNYKPVIYTAMLGSFLLSLRLSKHLAKENINENLLNISSIISAFLTSMYIEESDRFKNRGKSIFPGLLHK